MSDHFVLKGGIGTIDAERDIFFRRLFLGNSSF